MRRQMFFISIIVLVWAVIYLGSLFQPPLMDDADTVHAEAAREMVETGDWVTLKINDGFRYLEKAPLRWACWRCCWWFIVLAADFIAMKAAFTRLWRWEQDLGRLSTRGS
jgi:hypothetical protein